jgi:hypothetical protein
MEHGIRDRGVPRGDAQDARASPLPPLCIPPPAMCIPPLPSLKGWLLEKMRQWATRKKIKFVYLNIRQLDNNLLTVEPRAEDLQCFDADPDPDPAQNLNADPDPDPYLGGGGVGQPKMCIPPGKILGTPLIRDTHLGSYFRELSNIILG